MLTLPIKKKWFDLIVSGEKKEEYRKISKWYTSAFHNAMNDDGTFRCVIRNGYSSTSPTATLTVKLSIGHGKPEWGAESDVEYYILSILDVEK